MMPGSGTVGTVVAIAGVAASTRLAKANNRVKQIVDFRMLHYLLMASKLAHFINDNRRALALQLI